MDQPCLSHIEPERDKAKLLQIAKVTAATGVSRATILRMEERGLLTPAHISPSGQRYYDAYNLTRIMEVQRLQAMGFTNEEALHYFSSGGDAEGMLTLVEKKLHLLQWTYEEMKLRALNTEYNSTELVHLDRADYYVERARLCTPQEKNIFAYNAYRNCVEKGYTLAPGPLILIHECDDFLTSGFPPDPYQVASCTPVQSGQSGPEIETLPGGPALMMLFCGDYEQLNKSYMFMGQQVRQRGLTPAGHIRTIWVVGPYVGRELTINRYRARIILPVEE